MVQDKLSTKRFLTAVASIFKTHFSVSKTSFVFSLLQKLQAVQLQWGPLASWEPTNYTCAFSHNKLLLLLWSLFPVTLEA